MTAIDTMKAIRGRPYVFWEGDEDKIRKLRQELSEGE